METPQRSLRRGRCVVCVLGGWEASFSVCLRDDMAYGGSVYIIKRPTHLVMDAKDNNAGLDLLCDYMTASLLFSFNYREDTLMPRIRPNSVLMVLLFMTALLCNQF